MRTHTFSPSVSVTHTHTHQISVPKPLTEHLSLLGLISEGTKAPTEILTHFLLRSLFGSLAALLHSQTADKPCSLPHQPYIYFNWGMTDSATWITPLRWGRSPDTFCTNLPKVYFCCRKGCYLKISHSSCPFWGCGPQVEIGVLGTHLTQIKKGFKKKKKARERTRVSVCAHVCGCVGESC